MADSRTSTDRGRSIPGTGALVYKHYTGPPMTFPQMIEALSDEDMDLLDKLLDGQTVAEVLELR
jgi:hypothetical protein